jgi:hypothetical protein
MRVTQISVFLENRPGRLLQLLQILTDAHVNLQALSMADTADFGIARIIVEDTPSAMQAIRAGGLTVAINDVLRVQIPDSSGGLAEKVIAPLSAAAVNVEYLYAYSERASGQAIVVLKVDDLDKAEAALQ